MTEQLPDCLECGLAYTYKDRGLSVCPECGHEWSPTEEVAEEGLVVKDSNDNLLADGDSVTVIKDLEVEGANDTIKQGTEVKDIRLVEGDHNIDCEVDGFSPVKLRPKFIKKN